MGKVVLTIWLTTFGADAATTHVVLQQGTGREYLIPTQNPFAIDAVIAGEAGIGYWALKKLRTRHPKLATALTIAVVGIHGAAAIHNATLIK